MGAIASFAAGHVAAKKSTHQSIDGKLEATDVAKIVESRGLHAHDSLLLLSSLDLNG